MRYIYGHELFKWKTKIKKKVNIDRNILSNKTFNPNLGGERVKYHPRKKLKTSLKAPGDILEMGDGMKGSEVGMGFLDVMGNAFKVVLATPTNESHYRK